jgi:hypothetical protein
MSLLGTHTLRGASGGEVRAELPALRHRLQIAVRGEEEAALGPARLGLALQEVVVEGDGDLVLVDDPLNPVAELVPQAVDRRPLVHGELLRGGRRSGAEPRCHRQEDLQERLGQEVLGGAQGPPDEAGTVREIDEALGAEAFAEVPVPAAAEGVGGVEPRDRIEERQIRGIEKGATRHEITHAHPGAPARRAQD